MRHAAFAAAVLGFSSLAISGEAPAAVYTVNSTTDAADPDPTNGVCQTALDNVVCTLRAAVMEANHHAGSTVNVPGGATYSLFIAAGGTDDEVTGDLNIKANMTIQRTGTAPAVVDAVLLGDRIFHVEAGATATMSGLTLQKGSVSGGSGGGVRCDGTLTLQDCLILQCSASLSGGGIDVFIGTLALIRTAVNQCTAGGAGAGIAVNAGTVTVDSSTIAGNQAAAFGGGLYAINGLSNITVRASTITGNTAESGGGIHAYGSAGLILSTTNTTVSGNSARVDAGGIYVGNGATGRFFSTTIASNEADVDLNGTGTGGGIHNEAGGLVYLNHGILAYNLESAQQGPTTWVPALGDCAGAMGAVSPSILTAYAASHCTPSGSFTSTDPMLGDLARNGGPNRTRALLQGSPALDAGTSAGCVDEHNLALMVDQRGVHRPIGAKCDIGAFEVEPIGDANGDGVVNVSDVLYLINTLFAGGPDPLGRVDANGDDAINVSDVLFLINYLFAGGPAPV